LVFLKELYLADNVLLNGLLPSLPGLISLDIKGTELDSGEEGSATWIESICTGDVLTFISEEFDESGAAQPFDVIIIAGSSVGALVLAVVIAIIFFISKRRTKNQRRRDDQKKLNEARNNLYQMSKAYNEAAGNTEYSNLVFISLIH
jgi:hypothetical protein